MKKQLRMIGGLVFLSVATVVGNLPVVAAEGDLRVVQDDSTVTISQGDQPVLHYRYQGVPMKPYVDQLFTPSGAQVLRDSPPDHKHHHGLMFALAVDGVNFWEENDADKGKQLHQSLQVCPVSVENGTARAGFVEDLEWVGPQGGTPLLVEQRAIDVLRMDDVAATIVLWKSRLQPPPGKPSAVLGGNYYFGLGMRFPASMDRGGRLFHADDRTVEALPTNDAKSTTSPWSAYSAKVDDKPVTVAIFDQPKNPRYPAKMFTLTQPFAYLSATLNLWKEPITLEAGKPMNLCYAVVVFDGETDASVVEKLYQRLFSTP